LRIDAARVLLKRTARIRQKRWNMAESAAEEVHRGMAGAS